MRSKKIAKLILIIIFIGVVASPFIIIYFLNNGNPYHTYLVNKHIPAHLEELGYTDEDILKQNMIAPKLAVNRSVYYEHYRVIFEDEPEVEYLYGLTKKGKNVVQFCEKNTVIDEITHLITKKTKHSEKECINYLENKN